MCSDRLIALLAFATFSVACNDTIRNPFVPRDRPPRTTPDGSNDNPSDGPPTVEPTPPELPTDAEWTPLGAPPSGGGSHEGPNYVGKIDDQLLLQQHGWSHVHHLVAYPAGGRASAIADAVNAKTQKAEVPVQVAPFGDHVYLVTRDNQDRFSAYRCTESCQSWNRLSYNFRLLQVAEGRLWGVTAEEDQTTGSSDRQAPSTLLARGENDSEWSTIRSDVSNFNVCGDVLHISGLIAANDWGFLYSTDRGTSWNPHPDEDARIRDFLFADRPIARFQGRAFASLPESSQTYSSDDCIEWQTAMGSSSETALRDFTQHDGQLFAIETDEGHETNPRPPAIVQRSEEGWVRHELPARFYISHLRSRSDNLLVQTAQRGMHRFDPSTDSMTPVGPALTGPGDIATSGQTIAALRPCGLETCVQIKPKPGADWKLVRYPRNHYLTIRPIETGFLLTDFDDETKTTRLYELSVAGESERLHTFDGEVRIDALGRTDGKIYAALHKKGFKRIVLEESTLADVSISGDIDCRSIETLTESTDSLLALCSTGGGLQLLESTTHGDVDFAPVGAPSDINLRGKPKGILPTDDHLFAYGLGSSYTDSVFWIASRRFEGWRRIPAPDEVMGDEFISSVTATAHTLYASSKTEVFQYDSASREWTSISRGLDTPLNRLTSQSLAATDDRLYASMSGRGIWTYPGPSPH